MSDLSSSSLCSILDMPDEILAKIFLNFNLRKRLAIANSCSRFSDLIFTDKELIRDLDFSRNGRLVTLQHIQQYFSDKTAFDLILKLNFQNVNCLTGGQMLCDTIGRAVNLVDLNIHGIQFKDIVEVGNLLEPFSNLKRLSFDWPEATTENQLSSCTEVLRKPFSNLLFLSVKLCVYLEEFFPTVQICDKLRELHMITSAPADRAVRDMSWSLEKGKLQNLEIVQARGWYSVDSFKQHVVRMVPDPLSWTDFQLIDIFKDPGFYLEKNVQVCAELRATKLMEFVPYLYLHHHFEFGWFLASENLLSEVIKMTHKDAPKNFCSLTPFRSDPIMNIVEEPCLLKIEDAKKLLADPKYQISFLHFKHSIAPDCDAHLVASAFPNITELVLTHIIKNEDGTSTNNSEKLERHLKRRDDTESDDDDKNSDSSFKMLIENTPHVKDLTIYARNICDEGIGRWDLDALFLIPQWRNLRILRLAFVPVQDGKFLIHIGKECPKLETLILRTLGFSRPCCYTKDLSLMLNDCRNLIEFSIDQGEVKEIPEILEALSQNLKIKRVCINNFSEDYDSAILIPAIENLLHRCKKLNSFVFIIERISDENLEHLTSTLTRIKRDLNRSKFQFQAATARYSENNSEKMKINTVYMDASSSFFLRKLEWFEDE